MAVTFEGYFFLMQDGVWAPAAACCLCTAIGALLLSALAVGGGTVSIFGVLEGQHILVHA